MRIEDLAGRPDAVIEQAATLLVREFDQPGGWPTIELDDDSDMTSLAGRKFARCDSVVKNDGARCSFARRVSM